MGLLACSSGGELPAELQDPAAEPEPPAEPDVDVIRVPFLVDDYFVPSGCFGDNYCNGGVIDINSRACDERPARARGVCRRFTYEPLAAGEAGYEGYLGVLFQQAIAGDTAIGRVPGRLVERSATRVVFWAKVGSGSVDVEFRAGGANNWMGQTNPELPYKDEFGVPANVTLNREFQRIAIDLTGVSYREVVSPFGWSVRGLTEPIELFVDDVRWE